jgi:beta-lactamase regulating signal transducer with metallopeptidase domain
MSANAALLITAVFLLRTFTLNRLPKFTFLLLWGVVLLRLLVPFYFPVRLDILPAPAVAPVVAPAVFTSAPPPAHLPETTHFTLPLQETTPAIPQEIPPPIPTATIIWLAGAVAMLAYFAVVYVRSHALLRHAVPLRGNAFTDGWRHKHNIPILQSDRISTPLAVGILRPRIVLPLTMSMHDTRLLQHVLTHEYVHIRRRDAIWKILLSVALCLHWFNPLVWLMYLCANRDLEVTCADMTLRKLGLAAKSAYAHSLLAMAAKNSPSPHPAFSKNAAKRNLHERIVAIMKTSNYPRKRIAIATLLVLVLSFGAFTVFAIGERAADYTPPYEPTYEPAYEEFTWSDAFASFTADTPQAYIEYTLQYSLEEKRQALQQLQAHLVSEAETLPTAPFCTPEWLELFAPWLPQHDTGIPQPHNNCQSTSYFSINGERVCSTCCHVFTAAENAEIGWRAQYQCHLDQLQEQHPGIKWVVVKCNQHGGWSSYNAELIVTPSGAVITSFAFMEAKREYEANGGTYMPEALRLLFAPGPQQ